MKDIEAFFSNKKMNIEKLLSFGFISDGNGYKYNSTIFDGQFEIVVNISKDGKVKADVIDCLTGEVYVLVKVPQATGAYVGKIRTEYEKLLSTIAHQCFNRDVFKSEHAKEIISYIKNKYDDELEFLWDKFPKNAIFRRKDNRKWYATLSNLPQHKIGLTGEENIDIISLRGDTKFVETIIDGKKYFLGYHMNKKHWFTICLNGSISKKEICNLIDESYKLTK